MQPIKHYCPKCNGLLKIENVLDDARKSIIRVDVTCQACGTGSAPVSGVPFKSNTSPLSPAAALALLSARDVATKKLIE